MAIIEYPKSLYLKGWDDLDAMVIVYDEEGEKAARAKGYKGLAENEVIPASLQVEVKRGPGRPPKASE